jgi:hypothetical protein
VAQLAGQFDHLRPRFCVALPAPALLTGGNLAIACGFQLGDRGSFLELGDGA